MLNKIIYYSLHNRLVVLICSLLLMIAGTYTACLLYTSDAADE